MNLTYQSDTKHRKQFFTGMSFSHPAKMVLPLQLWLIGNYSKPGDVILDPMSGSGTILVACSMSRHVICVELEAKFIEIIKGNWQKIQERGPQMGYTMGKATIIQGDARNLEGLLCDAIVTSPPYADNPGTPSLGSVNKDDWGKEGTDIVGRRGLERGYSKETEGQLGNLKYGSIDAVISSPPYEGTEAFSDKEFMEREHKAKYVPEYTGGQIGNIGNLKNDSYLSAMLQVYQQCFKVLKAGGVMCLVVKSYIRNKQIVDLAADTIKLCGKAGFTFQERHSRILTAQSFWRTLYARKYPDAPEINTEDILIFSKLRQREMIV